VPLKLGCPAWSWSFEKQQQQRQNLNVKRAFLLPSSLSRRRRRNHNSRNWIVYISNRNKDVFEIKSLGFFPKDGFVSFPFYTSTWRHFEMPIFFSWHWWDVMINSTCLKKSMTWYYRIGIVLPLSFSFQDDINILEYTQGAHSLLLSLRVNMIYKSDTLTIIT